MLIAVWNMSHWQKSVQERADAWQWLEGTGADIALVQEAVPPSSLSKVVYKEIGNGRPWGSAVVGFSCAVTAITECKGRCNSQPVDLHRTVPGSVAVASAAVEGRTMTFVSMYGVIEDGYADTTVNRQLSDLVPLFDNPSASEALLLGGDLNITTQWVGGQTRYRAWEAVTLQRLSAFGCVMCWTACGPMARLKAATAWMRSADTSTRNATSVRRGPGRTTTSSSRRGCWPDPG